MKELKLTGSCGRYKIPPWTEPKIAEIKEPKELRKYRFFTHRTVGQDGGFTLTEATTGLAVIQECKTRSAAITQGLKRILDAGLKRFEECVRESRAR